MEHIVKTCSVAGLLFDIILPEDFEMEDRLGNYKPFITSVSEGDRVFTLEYCAELSRADIRPLPVSVPDNELEPRIDISEIILPEGKSGFQFEMAPTQAAPAAGKMRMITGQTGTSAYFDTLNRFVIDNSLMLLFAVTTERLNALEMHASVIVHTRTDGSERGYLFLGPSGTGKSTHSRLWLKNIPHTRLLNDDNPVIRISDDGVPMVYGSPWSGKTPCYIDDSVPIGGIVTLHQAPHNFISRQTSVQAYASIISSCSGLKFVEESNDRLFDTISEVIRMIPCFDLECLPDADAAHLCMNTLENK